MLTFESFDSGSENVTKILIQNKADVNLPNYEDVPPLIAAAFDGNS